ncbi:MAG: serine hydrolase domain-containing protein [Sciscionella sp.]
MLPPTDHALLHRVATEQSTCRAPSMVAAVVRDGAIAFSTGRGAVSDPLDTQYRIGSITKTFVAVLVMRLRDEGLLDLADPLEQHLPGTPFGDRSIGALISQSAGLGAEAPRQWWERTPGREWPELLADLGAEDLKHRSGRRFHYSNLGFGVLGELVATLRGHSWLVAADKEILAPLGMRRTTPRPVSPRAQGYAVHPYADVLLAEPEHDAVSMAPAGQLWSTVTDLARWTAFLGGDTAEVLDADTVQEMREPVAVADADTWKWAYGCGLQLTRDRGRRLAGHTGSMPGFLATTLIDPATATGALAMANSTSGVGIDTLVCDLIDLAATLEPAIPAAWQPGEGVDGALLPLAGPWFWGPTPFELRPSGNGWFTLGPKGGARSSRFRPHGDGTYLGLDAYYAGETLTVHRNAAGEVTHLNLATFIFTRTPYDSAAPVPGGVDELGWQGR